MKHQGGLNAITHNTNKLCRWIFDILWCSHKKSHALRSQATLLGTQKYYVADTC